MMLDEDFFAALQTHMQRLVRSVEQDTEFMTNLGTLATERHELRPMFQHFFTISTNQTEAIAAITSDLAQLTKFGLTLIALASGGSRVLPPQDNTISET